MIRFTLAISVALLSSAISQPLSYPDPAAQQRALIVLQQQRNQAMDAHANAEMRVMYLTEELEKLKSELAAAKAKPDAVKP